MVFMGLFMIDFKIICQIINNLFPSATIVLLCPMSLVVSLRVPFLALCSF